MMEEGQMVLGFLALGRKTQAGQAGNSQRSEEGMLPYRSPVCSKVPGSFSQRRCTGGTGGLKCPPGRDWSGTGGQHYLGPIRSSPGPGPSTGEGDREDRPCGVKKHHWWPTRGHGDPRNYPASRTESDRSLTYRRCGWIKQQEKAN